MSGYIRSIRGIERSQAYSPVSAVNRYAAYRNREEIEPTRAEPAHGWDDWEAISAKSAAAWLRTAKAAEGKLNSLMIELGRQEGWRDAAVTEEKLRELKGIVHELAAVYTRYEDQLQPEVWEVIELALRHPATTQLGLASAVNARGAENSGNTGNAENADSLGNIKNVGHAGKTGSAGNTTNAGHAERTGSAGNTTNAGHAEKIGSAGNTTNAGHAEKIGSAGNTTNAGHAEHSAFRNGSWTSEPVGGVAASQGDRDRVRRLLLGADGLLVGLKRAVTYAEQQQTSDWLKLPFTAAYPYALYYGAAQLYWPLPGRGSIVNKYI